jgi:hypothetical protein
LRPNADKVAQQINDFLGNTAPDARLDLTEGERTSYWLGWALLPVSVVLLVILGWVLFRNDPAQARTDAPLSVLRVARSAQSEGFGGGAKGLDRALMPPLITRQSIQPVSSSANR